MTNSKDKSPTTPKCAEFLKLMFKDNIPNEIVIQPLKKLQYEHFWPQDYVLFSPAS